MRFCVESVATHTLCVLNHFLDCIFCWCTHLFLYYCGCWYIYNAHTYANIHILRVKHAHAFTNTCAQGLLSFDGIRSTHATVLLVAQCQSYVYIYVHTRTMNVQSVSTLVSRVSVTICLWAIICGVCLLLTNLLTTTTTAQSGNTQQQPQPVATLLQRVRYDILLIQQRWHTDKRLGWLCLLCCWSVSSAVSVSGLLALS